MHSFLIQTDEQEDESMETTGKVRQFVKVKENMGTERTVNPYIIMSVCACVKTGRGGRLSEREG